MQPQAALLSSIEDEHPLQALRKSTRCVQGQQWAWDGVRFEVLRPLPADYEAANKSNAMSCVLRITSTGAAGPQTVLLAGDIEKPQEDSLVHAYGKALKADVLLVPHHGSKTSSSAAFLDAVRPRIALIQAGYRNRFGHPAAPVVERYEERQVLLADSPHCGAAMWASATPQTVRCHRTESLRYWRHRVP